jgi:hypothetical protein
VLTLLSLDRHPPAGVRHLLGRLRRAADETWDCSDALHELWSVVLESRVQEDRGGKVDYEACLLALEEEEGGEVHA